MNLLALAVLENCRFYAGALLIISNFGRNYFNGNRIRQKYKNEGSSMFHHEKKNNHNHSLLAYGLLSIPLILQVIWQFTNNELPIADGGDHYRVAYLIYLAFTHGMKHGIHFTLHTGGKPILFSFFVSPFVYL